jgi:hypothetical protein
MSHPELSQLIENELKKRKSLKLSEDAEIKVGQIRKINDKDLLSESRLGLIVGLNKLGKNCEVVLVNGLPEFATDRDFEAKLIGFESHLTVFVDFQGNVDLDQVEVPTLIGTICETCSREINEIRISTPVSTEIQLPEHGCFKRGNASVLPLSRLSRFRDEEYSTFFKLLNQFDDYAKFIEYREFQYFYSKKESLGQLISDISQILPEAFQREEYLKQIKKNPRQLAVLRGR